jgi:hypothetical protein
MTVWTTDELDRIGEADELSVTTARPDGSLRSWVPIWVVRAGDELYVRSYRGADGAWYRHATQDGAARTPSRTASWRSTTPTGRSTPATALPTCSRCSPPVPSRPRCG